MRTTRITKKFDDLAQSGQTAFIAYITAGDPKLADTVEIVSCLEDAGVDLIELGLPFSDPLADGPTNQAAAERALRAGATFENVMNCIAEIRRKSELPIVIYSYMNPLCARGFENAMQMASAAGVDGFLILDLPFEESEPYCKSLSENNLNRISLITPTTSEKRMARIVDSANGFIYCVSRSGVTGMREALSADASVQVQLIKQRTDLPVALGFGISNPEQAAAAARSADAVVVGSAIVNRFHENPHTPQGRKDAAEFVRSLVEAVKNN